MALRIPVRPCWLINRRNPLAKLMTATQSWDTVLQGYERSYIFRAADLAPTRSRILLRLSFPILKLVCN
jgi:hypothetical protein